VIKGGRGSRGEGVGWKRVAIKITVLTNSLSIKDFNLKETRVWGLLNYCAY
jgi:hypothetical protein